MDDKQYTIMLSESEARTVHKLVQDYLLRNGHPGEYGAPLLSAEIAITQQLFEGQGMPPGEECYCDPEKCGLICKTCAGWVE